MRTHTTWRPHLPLPVTRARLRATLRRAHRDLLHKAIAILADTALTATLAHDRPKASRAITHLLRMGRHATFDAIIRWTCVAVTHHCPHLPGLTRLDGFWAVGDLDHGQLRLNPHLNADHLAALRFAAAWANDDRPMVVAHFAAAYHHDGAHELAINLCDYAAAALSRCPAPCRART